MENEKQVALTDGAYDYLYVFNEESNTITLIKKDKYGYIEKIDIPLGSTIKIIKQYGGN